MQLYGRLNHYCSSTVTGILGVAELLEGPVELTYFTARNGYVSKSKCPNDAL